MRRICWPLVLLLLTASCTSVPPNRKMPPPFMLTADEQKNVDCLLARWEQWNAGVKTFDCRFKRWTYDTVFGPPDQPKWVDLGEIKYAAPDHALYRIDKTENNGKEVPIEFCRAEQWISDGKALSEWSRAARQVTEYKLAPGGGGAVALDGPLTLGPFVVMGGKAEGLKEQYYLREVTPPGGPHDRICLEAYPRTGLLAASVHHLQIILRASDMSPYALRIVQPNGRDHIVYQFYDMAVNKPLTPGDPFHPPIPKGWRKEIVELPLDPPAKRPSLHDDTPRQK